MSSNEERYRASRRVTLVGAAVNAVLAFGKIVLGVLGQSQALIADGVHSLADLGSDAVVLLAAKHGAREADEDHPYGHGRIETVVTVGLGVMLIAVAGAIMYDAITRIMEPDRLLHPSWYALVAAFVSILANEGLFQYSVRVARQFNSRMLLANAWHHRTDAISSIIAVVGIGGSMAGLPLLDAIAAIGVSIMIAKVGWDIAWSSLQELVDTALDEEQVERIRNKILTVDGVREAHSLRTRSMGGQALVDVHILIDNPRISVSEGHHIGEAVLHTLLEEVDEVADVVVHIDPEDDEMSAPNRGLPLRDEIIASLNDAWKGEAFASQVKNITLHYLGGKIFVDLDLPLALVSESENIRQVLTQVESRQAHITNIQPRYI